MIKIVDVDWQQGFELELQFSNGLQGKVDLTSYFTTALNEGLPEEEFCHFSLEDDGLYWANGVKLENQSLHDLTVLKGRYKLVSESEMPPMPDDFEAVVKQALWDSVTMKRPDIFQAAIKGFVDKLGVSNVQQVTSIKSRPSIYKSLNNKNSPKFSTLIELAHGVYNMLAESVGGNTDAANQLKHEYSASLACGETNLISKNSPYVFKKYNPMQMESQLIKSHNPLSSNNRS